jgi:hypothetical protein
MLMREVVMVRWRLPTIVTFAVLLTASCPYTQMAGWLGVSQNPDSTNAIHLPPDDCPLTQPSLTPFVPPPPNAPNAPYGFWYGTDALWTVVPSDGVWSSLPYYGGTYSQKVLWWRQGYSWTEEPQPELSVTGQRLDASAPPLRASRATNAFAPDIQSAMLVGIDLPTDGCWEITGRYRDTELSFVVWVAP